MTVAELVAKLQGMPQDAEVEFPLGIDKSATEIVGIQLPSRLNEIFVFQSTWTGDLGIVKVA